jgi:hypothetical protein
MGLTSERKVFIGLFVVAGAALIIDQGILGPQSASADLVQPPTDLLVTSEQAQVVKPKPKPAAAILIERLRAKDAPASESSIDSAFSLTQLIEPAMIEQAISGEQIQLGQSDESNQSFPAIVPQAVDLPILSSVMPSSSGGGAVLGGKLVRAGQVGPNGYRLVLVHARSVLVEKDGVQYAIEIPTVSSPN